MDGNLGISLLFIIFVVGMCAISHAKKKNEDAVKAKTNALQAQESLILKEIAKLGFETGELVIKAIASASVGKLEEIVAKELRQKVKDGEAEKSELYALAEEAYKDVISVVTPELIEELSKSVSNVELYIRNQIENQLLLLKAKMNGGAADE